MTRVAYFTTARSDYGPAYWVIRDLAADARVDLRLAVSGSHLGGTIGEIEKDGFDIAARLDVPLGGNDALSHAGTASALLAAAARFLERERVDIAVVYGDRYELLAIAAAAAITRTPLAHICGGDVTEGAIDEQVRHAVTKVAHLHFPSTARSAERVLQMGEEPWRVHMTGDPALDHFTRGRHASIDELENLLGFRPDRGTLVVTFHPPTLEPESAGAHARALADALRQFDGSVVITAPAPDPGAAAVRAELERLASERPRTRFVDSLGSARYRGLLQCAGAVVGNSSSGLIEAGCVPLPAVNIGSRQAGRERGHNVIDVQPDTGAIVVGIEQALDPAFVASLSPNDHPYGDGRAARRIVDVLAALPDRNILLKKRFVQIDAKAVA